MSGVNTDRRILSILRSGKSALSAVDPDAVVVDSRVSELQLRLDNNVPVWSLVLDCPTGDSILVSGVFTDTGVKILRVWICSGEDKFSLPVKAAARLIEAFGNLSGLPDHLKKNLSFQGLDNGNSLDSGLFRPSLFGMVMKALFYGVDGADDHSLVSQFRLVRILYDYSSDGVCYAAHLNGFHKSFSYEISVSSDIDVYGLKGKRLCLFYSFGLGRSMDADCFVLNDGKKKPSLRLAFDLAGKLSGMYMQERDKSNGISEVVSVPNGVLNSSEVSCCDVKKNAESVNHSVEIDCLLASKHHSSR